MIKKIATGLLLVSSISMAADSTVYIGYGITSGSGTYTNEKSTGTTATDDKDFSGSTIKIGVIKTNKNRVELSISNDKMAETASYYEQKIRGYNIDWYGVYGEKTTFISPYITLGLGAQTWLDTAQYFVSNEDLTGVSFNYGIGALINIPGTSDKLEAEIAYKGKRITWKDYISGSATYSPSNTYQGIYLGLNLKF